MSPSRRFPLVQLTAIPGVGEKTAEALASLEDPEGAIENGDVAALAQAPGVSPSRAARIARSAIKARHDDEGDFLATDRARSIYRDLLDLLQARAVTDFGTHRLETLYPSTAASRIEEVQETVRAAIDHAPDPDVQESLADVHPLREPRNLRIRDRCLATSDAERYERAVKRYPEISVEIIENARGLADLASGYAEVIALDEGFAGLDLDENVRVEPDALDEPVEVVPERTLAFFARNRNAIRAAIDVHREAGLEPPTDYDALEESLASIDAEGTPVGDAERDRLRMALDDLDASIGIACSVADDHLRDAIETRDVTVEGTDLLSMVERGAGVDALLSRELHEEFDEAIAAAQEHLIDGLRLTKAETTHVERIFPNEPTFPVAPNESAVERLREDLQFAHDRRAAAIKEELARSLADTRPAVNRLVSRALELDFELAIARFAADFECTMPRFEGEGIAIDGGRSPLLGLPIDEIDPVEYAVADTVLLSGVNSGGKTSLLDLVAATAILAHMGLPVPADDVRLQRFEALHYHAATQGTLDAGAFEATVQQFAELATEDGDRLVLVDELESITEPGAAAIIVGGILEELRGDVTAVFVSHLASEIREVTDVDIRVDGIRAAGVQDGELVVDRTPVRDHLARSTPELIVEQLAATGEGPRTAIYEALLEKFEQS